MNNQAKIISGQNCQIESTNFTEPKQNSDRNNTNISSNSNEDDLNRRRTEAKLNIRFEEDEVKGTVGRIMMEEKPIPKKIYNNKQFLEDIESSMDKEVRMQQDVISNPIDKNFIDSFEDEILMPRQYLRSFCYPLFLNIFIIATSLILFRAEVGIDFLLDQDLVQFRHFVAFNFIAIFLIIPVILFLKEHSYHTDVSIKGLLWPTLILYTGIGIAFLYCNLVFLSFYSVGLTNLVMLLLVCIIVNFTVLALMCLSESEVFDPIHSILVSFTFNIMLLLFTYLLFFKGHNQVFGFLVVYFLTVSHAFYINYNIVFILVYRNIKKWALVGNLWVDLFKAFPRDISTKLNGKEIFVRLDE